MIGRADAGHSRATWAIWLLTAGLLACDHGEPLIVAVDTVVAETGIVESLAGQAKVGPIQVVPVSSGDALLLGDQARADLLLVAAPAGVAWLEARGRVAAQVEPFHNEYVLVGREADLAKLHLARNGALGLRQINRTGASFTVPRRGSSARFKLEELWKLQTDVRISPSFVGVDGDVRDAVLQAHAQGTYALVDRVTRLTYLEPKGLNLRVLLTGGAELANGYQLILLRATPTRSELQERADRLFRHFTSQEAQSRIAAYGVTRHGEPLFDVGPPPPPPLPFQQLPGEPTTSPDPAMAPTHPAIPGGNWMPSPAPLRPGAEQLPNPHGPGGMPMRAPHGPI